MTDRSPAWCVVIFAACSTSAAEPLQAPPQVRVVVPQELDLDADVDPAAKLEPHRCKRSAIYPDGKPPEYGGEDMPHGATAEQLNEEAAKKTPIAGTCDLRLRDRVEASILSAKPTQALAATPAWDHKGTVQFWDRVGDAVALTDIEQRQLARDGMVVPARLQYADYSSAYYDIHRGQLPIFVTADSILHAIYASHDHLLASLERELLVDKLDAALGRMHCMLAAAAKDYPPDVAEDLDLYLTVARSLLARSEVPAELGAKTEARARRIVTEIEIGDALTTVELFGRQRAFDASQYKPRGHYTDEELQPYFRAAMWLSRLEFNLMSRDTRSSQPGFVPDTSETPREAVTALALADLAERSGALADLGTIERTWGAFAGGREDVSLADLIKLRNKAAIHKLKIPESADKLRAVIGERYRRSINIFPNPDVKNLPVIATVLGPRITPDLAGLAALPTSDDPGTAAAALAYALGHDRALAYTGKLPRAELGNARAVMAMLPVHDDLYGAWLDAIRALGHRVAGAQPSFAATTTYQDLRLDSALAAFGQLRHNHVLIEAQRYSVGGCEIPDGYVEAVPEVYDALARWAKHGERVFASLDPKDTTGGAKYFRRTGHLVNVLATIARHELANRPLTADEKRFLAMAVEMRAAEAWDYNGPFPLPTYDGWYLDLFPNSDAAFHAASFIADYGTHVTPTEQWVDYLGARGPRLGLFVVDVGGAPRLMAGPVAQAFAASGPVAQRFSDETADQAVGHSPWAASYTSAAAPEPKLHVLAAEPSAKPSRGRKRELDRLKLADGALVLESDRSLGDVTIELRDHHFVKLGSFVAHVTAGRTETKLPDTAGVESLLVRLGAFAGRVDFGLDGLADHAFGVR
jgi:hypothetical protein